MTQVQLEQIRKFAEEVAAREGCQLYDVEFHDGPGRALRVFIDRDQGGVSIDDCAKVSRGLNLRLDVEDAVPGGAYDLEVSSPGLDRRLTQLWHFGKAVGQTIQLKYRDESGKTGSYEGKLVAVEGNGLKFENSKDLWMVDFAAVQRARILPIEVLKPKPRPGKKKR